jgi:hypothetical protein
MVADHEQHSAGTDCGGQRGKQPGPGLRRQLQELRRDRVETARLRRFGGWHDPIPPLAAADPGAVLHHDLYELPPLKTYTSGNVVLVGDAAHAMTPQSGAGSHGPPRLTLLSVIRTGLGTHAPSRRYARLSSVEFCGRGRA